MDKENLKKNVFMAVRWGVRVAPTLFMLSHWCLIMMFHHNPWEVVVCADGNEIYLFAGWFMTWIFPMGILWCAGYLFDFGFVWKIPFGYALGVIVVRASNWTLVANNSTRFSDYTLIAIVLIVYWAVLVCTKDKEEA